jgi:TRAP-type transport system large permease protein
MILWITIAVLLLLILINVPVSFSLIAASFVYFMFNDSFSGEILVQRMVGGIESFPLLAIIFFIAAGILMNYTGITDRMLNFASVITSNIPGRLGQVSVLLATMMGGLSGSNIADAAMQAKILVPTMEEKGYPKPYAAALNAAASLITPIIPPGIALIMYGFVGQVSIGALFLAGVIPGLLLCIVLMVYVYLVAKKRKFEPASGKNPSVKEVLLASKDAVLALLLPVIIIGGIRFGIFSATEAGAIAVIYAIILGFFVFREMKIKNLIEALVETVHISASILIILAGASAFAWILTLEQVPQKLTSFVVGFIHTPQMFFIVILIFLLIVGMFIEGNVALVILTPIFMPMLQAYHINPVHFGIFFILCLSIGTLTPPLGTVMFVVTAITKVKIEHFLKEIVPYWVLLIVITIIIAFVPAISLWMPSFME